MDRDPVPARNVRVGDGERDAVVELLREAAAHGRLTMSEFDERLDAALQAKTYADLDPLVADLPVEPPSRSWSRGSLPVHGPPPPGYSREDTLRIDGGASSEKRHGVWTMPPFIRISQGLGTVKLHCLEAIPAAPLIDIEVIAGAGSIVLVLPDGWAVDANRVAKALGSKSIKVPAQPAPDKPLLFMHGQLGLGTLTVRPPNWFDRRRSR
jgi:hypothetical protein